jgi:hypothetical protein
MARSGLPFVCALVACSGLAFAAPDDAEPPWFAGTEIVYLEIEAQTGGQATLTINDSDTAGTDMSLLDANGYDENDFAPRVFLGRHIWRGIGVAGRFFRLTDFDTHPPETVPGTTTLTNFSTESAVDRIELETTDAELTYHHDLADFRFAAAFGERWATFAAQSELESFGVFTSGNFHQIQLSNGSRFDGRGYTAALSVDYRVADWPLHVFVGYRTSDLDGESDSFGRAVGTLAVSPNPPLIGAATVTRNNVDETDMTIDEWQVGVRFDFGLGQTARGFVHATYETQDWELDGPPTGGAGFGGTSSDITLNSFSSAGLGSADLKGIAFATGVRW